MTVTVGVVLIIAGALAFLVSFANTDYNTGQGPDWTTAAAIGGAVGAVSGVVVLIAGIAAYFL